MNTSAPEADEKVINTLLLAALILAALVVVREGPYFDNMLQGWRFFTLAFFIGALAGFLGWTQAFHIVPTFNLSAQNRQPWIAALACALAFAGGGSYLNRTFAAPTGRTIPVAVDSVTASRDQWRVTVKTPGGEYRRYIVSKEAAASVKEQSAARLDISRGVLGFEFVAGVEPQGR
jgi:hypothetical protein